MGFKMGLFNYRSRLNRNKLLNNRRNYRSLKNISVKFTRSNLYLKNNLKLLTFSIQFIINKINNKILVLFASSNGFFFYSICSSRIRVFRYYFFKKLGRRYNKRIKVLNRYIFKLPRLSKISLFSLNFSGGSTFCRAPGAYSTVLSFLKTSRLAMIKLPSKKKLLISFYNRVGLGKIKKLYKKPLINTKAGYLRLLGKKANSRGTCMNPIDHPHGGNTRSIKLHRTP